MALVYFVVKTKHAVDLSDALEASADAESLTYTIVTEGYDESDPNAELLRNQVPGGIVGVPSIVAIDDADNEKMSETLESEGLTGFISATQALYDAKYP